MALRNCGNCKQSKVATQFNWKNRIQGLRHSVCKECHAKYKRNHYLENRNLYIAKAMKWNSGQRLKLQKLVAEHLKKNPCVDCGETDMVVLDFDHISDKIKSIAELIQGYSSTQRLITEIKKCDVRCANCHRRKTARDRGYWKTLMGA